VGKRCCGAAPLGKDPRAGYQHGACLGGDYEVF